MNHSLDTSIRSVYMRACVYKYRIEFSVHRVLNTWQLHEGDFTLWYTHTGWKHVRAVTIFGTSVFPKVAMGCDKKGIKLLINALISSPNKITTNNISIGVIFVSSSAAAQCRISLIPNRNTANEKNNSGIVHFRIEHNVNLFIIGIQIASSWKCTTQCHWELEMVFRGIKCSLNPILLATI